MTSQECEEYQKVALVELQASKLIKEGKKLSNQRWSKEQIKDTLIGRANMLGEVYCQRVLESIKDTRRC